MTRVLLALSLLGAGCLDAPPGSVAPDAATAGPDAGCPELAPLAPFADSFSTDALDWVEGDKPGRSGMGDILMSVSSGELAFFPSAASDDHAWLQTPTFDFSNGRVAARIVLVSTHAGVHPYFGIIGPGGDERMIHFDGETIAGPSDLPVPYSPADHAWWQVTSDEGLFRYQVSSDGIEWKDLESGLPGFTLPEVRFEVGVNIDVAADGDRGVFVIDDLDLPPC